MFPLPDYKQLSAISYVRYIRAQLAKLRVKTIEYDWTVKVIQENCSHSNLPKRELGEEYIDECPDCGYIFYSYSVHTDTDYYIEFS